MANMHYCMFENTNRDGAACVDRLGCGCPAGAQPERGGGNCSRTPVATCAQGGIDRTKI